MSNLQLDIDGRSARLAFDRPDVLNALSPELLEELIGHCETLAENDALGIVVLAGSGGNFTAGADLPRFLQSMETDPHGTADLGRRAAAAIGALPQITLAAIEGYCIGGGIVLAGACDMRIAADNSRFSIPEVDAGIPLSWGGMAALTRIVGETLANDLVISCRPFGPDEALAGGFVSRVIPAAGFNAEVQDLVESVCAKPPLVLRQTKDKIVAVRDGSFDAEDDAAAMVTALSDPETREIAETYIRARIRKAE